MLGFRKKITVQSFWQPRLDGMFSGKNEAGWDFLKTSFHDPALNAVEAKVFYAHMQAMTIQVVSMLITKSCSMDASIPSHMFVDKFLENNNHKDVIRLVSRYNSAFGSSATDGIRKMVAAFSEDVASSRLTSPTVEGFYSTLYQLVQQVSNMLGAVKLIP